MKPLIYKGLRKNVNRTEWVSSDEIKQSYSQIRLLAVENDAVLDFDLAFVVNNGNARVVGNRLEGYEHE